VRDDILITDLLNAIGPPGFTPADFGAEATATADTFQTTESFGLYAHTEWTLSDQLTLTLAGRYTDDQRAFRGSVVDNSGFLTGVPGTATVTADDQEDESNFSWRVGLDYQVNDQSLVYGSVSTGFKSGIFYSGAVPDPSGWGYVPRPRRSPLMRPALKPVLQTVSRSMRPCFITNTRTNNPQSYPHPCWRRFHSGDHTQIQGNGRRIGRRDTT